MMLRHANAREQKTRLERLAEELKAARVAPKLQNANHTQHSQYSYDEQRALEKFLCVFRAKKMDEPSNLAAAQYESRQDKVQLQS